MGRRLAVAALLALVVVSAGWLGMTRASAAVSTPSWVPVSPGSKPPAKVASVAAYDPATVTVAGLTSAALPAVRFAYNR